MIQRLFSFVAAIVATFAVPAPVFAQDAQEVQRLEQRAEQIVAAMHGEVDYTSVFAEVFVNALPEAQFSVIQGQLESQFGALIGLQSVEPVAPHGANIAIRFERGLASGQFALETQEFFRVTGFRLTELRPIGDSVAQLLEDVAALPGEQGLLIAHPGAGEPIAAHNADRQFAIGSTFKLYVLSALAHSIAAGERNWSDVVSLSVRSYPSGQMQDWPQGAPVTLDTLATLMISTSDNTATDQLMAVLGRDRIEAEVVAAGHSDPAATFPFMTTRELFVLKSGTNIDPGEYLSSDEQRRRDALDFLAGIERDPGAVEAAFTAGPNMIEIEWFASPNDIARLLQRFAALEDDTALQIMAVNPALTPAMRAQWDYAGYKGGSEPGVLNLSWLLRDAAGEWVVVTISWNNAQDVVDQSRLEFLAMRAIALVQ